MQLKWMRQVSINLSAYVTTGDVTGSPGEEQVKIRPHHASGPETSTGRANCLVVACCHTRDMNGIYWMLHVMRRGHTTARRVSPAASIRPIASIYKEFECHVGDSSSGRKMVQRDMSLFDQRSRPDQPLAHPYLRLDSGAHACTLWATQVLLDQRCGPCLGVRQSSGLPPAGSQQYYINSLPGTARLDSSQFDPARLWLIYRGWLIDLASPQRRSIITAPSPLKRTALCILSRAPHRKPHQVSKQDDLSPSLQQDMPEPFTLIAFATAKIAGSAMIAGHAHAAAWILGGAIAGTTLFAIGNVLHVLHKKGAMSKSKAKEYMKLARSLPEEERVELKKELQRMNEKWWS